MIEAGTATATDQPGAVALSGGFTGTPVVLTNVMSANGADVVDSAPLNVTAGGFDLQLQEGSLSDGVNGGETVGYIAISTGGDGTAGSAVIGGGLTSGNSTYNLGVSLADGAVFAETQSINETDAGNVAINGNTTGSSGTVSLRFDEETGDGESAHGAETVGIAGFERGLLLCLASGTLVETDAGPRPVEALHPGDGVLGPDGRPRTLRRVFRRVVEAEELAADLKLRPVRIAAGAMLCDLPVRSGRAWQRQR